MEAIKPVSDYRVHDKPVSFARIREVDEEQGIVICDLMDENNQVLAGNRYFSLDKESPKAAPFELECPNESAAPVVSASEEDAGPGRPNLSWMKAELQAWMDAQDPPIAYGSGESKGDLLVKIDTRDQENGGK